MEIPRGDPGVVKARTEGRLETRNKHERQRAVCTGREFGGSTLSDIPLKKPLPPGDRKTAGQAQNPTKPGDCHRGREIREHFSLGKGREGKVYDKEGGSRMTQHGHTHSLLSEPITQTFLPEGFAPGHT